MLQGKRIQNYENDTYDLLWLILNILNSTFCSQYHFICSCRVIVLLIRSVLNSISKFLFSYLFEFNINNPNYKNLYNASHTCIYVYIILILNPPKLFHITKPQKKRSTEAMYKMDRVLTNKKIKESNNRKRYWRTTLATPRLSRAHELLSSLKTVIIKKNSKQIS